jgi:hypothetical protein
MGTLNPFKTLTCHMCKQWIQESKDSLQEEQDVNEEEDDEEEFQFKGIPIAGENEGDSDDSWEGGEVEDSSFVPSAHESKDDEEDVAFTFHNHATFTYPVISIDGKPRENIKARWKWDEDYNHYSLPTLNYAAINDLAFKVGPVKDGLVRLEILPTIPITPNYYRHLPEITTIVPTPTSTCRRTPSLAISPIESNAQRLSTSS